MSQIRQVTEEYQLREVIRTAEQTTVFSALGPTGQQEVALKLITPSTTPVPDVNSQWFLKLMETLSIHTIAGYPTLLDYGFTPDGSAFFVTELCQGGNFADFSGLPPARTVPLLIRITQAIEDLARKAQSHLNVRADNILVTGDIGNEDIMVMGMGSAAYLSSEDPQSWLAQADPSNSYVAPERIDASLGSPRENWRADVYSLAMLVCKTLDAQVSHPGTDNPQVDLSARRGLLETEVLSKALETGLRRIPQDRKLSFPQLRGVLETAPIQSAGPAQFEATRAIQIPSDLTNKVSLPEDVDSSARDSEDPSTPGQPSLQELDPHTLPKLDPGADPSALGYETVASVPTDEFARKYGLTNDKPKSSSVQEELPPPVESAPPVSEVTETVSLELPDTLPPLEDSEAPHDQLDETELNLPPLPPEPAEETELPPVSADEAQPAAPLPPLAPDSPPAPEPTVPVPEEALPPLAEPSVPSEPPGEPGPLPPVAEESLPSPELSSELPPTVVTRDDQLLPEPEGALPPVVADDEQPPASSSKSKAPAKAKPAKKGGAAFTIGIAAAALIMFALTIGGGFWVYKKVATRVEPTPIPTPIPPTPVPSPTPLPEPVITFHPQLELADTLLLEGDNEGAQQALAALTAEERDLFSEHELALYDELMAVFEASEFDMAVNDLRGGLQYGSVKMLNRALAMLGKAEAEKIANEPGLADEIKQARRALEMHKRLWSAKNAGNHLLVLELGAKMKPLLPGYSGADTLRQQAAVTLLSRVDALTRAGDFERAINDLEKMRRLWPQRKDFEEKISWCRQQQGTEQRLASVLRSAQSKAAGGDPEEALRLLGSVTPEGSYRQRFAQAQQVFAEQLAKMDAKAPKVALKQGFTLHFKRNKMVRIPFEITDDYRVVSATITLRTAASSSFSSLPLEHVMDNTYSFQVTPKMHGNKPVYFYVTATDRSGNTSSLGSAEQPLTLKKMGWFR